MSPANRITRRHLLRSLPALVAASRVMAQPNKPIIRVRALNHMTLFASDPKRSLEFYQRLFGMPIQAPHGNSGSGFLRFGSGPHYLAPATAAAARNARIEHLSQSSERFTA